MNQKIQNQQIIKVSQLQKNMHCHNSEISPEIINAAIKMGYQPKDIFPISSQQIEKQYQMILKEMKPKEKQFYINKKIIFHQAKRQKIMNEVKNYVALMQRKQRDQLRMNKKVEKIFDTKRKCDSSNKHKAKGDKILLSNRQQSKVSSVRKRYALPQNTINVKQSSQKSLLRSRSPYSVSSQASRASIKSQVSQRSNKSSSSSVVSLSKSKLVQVRTKQKQAQQYRKKMLQQKIKHDQMKLLKAQQNLITKSRKAKIRSQISHRIVKQNKYELEMIKKIANHQHLQAKKFQILRNNSTREKKLRQISFSKNNQQGIFIVNSNKSKNLEKKKIENEYRYERKMKNSNDWQQNYKTIQQQSLFITKENHLSKALSAYERRTLETNQRNRIRFQTLSIEIKKQKDAQKRRIQQKQYDFHNQRQSKHFSSICNQIKNETVTKNKKIIQMGQTLINLALKDQYDKRVKDILCTENLKNTLEKGQFLDNHRKIKINQLKNQDYFRVRKSFTSGNHRQLIQNHRYNY